MILVTGAAGKTGRAVVKALAGRGKRVKALVFKSAYATEMVKLGAEEVVAGDLRQRAHIRKALKQVQAVYHICPNMHPEEIVIGETIIDELRRSDCRRIVYHSVLHPQTEAMPHHWQKLRVEEMLFESGLDYTILQPSAYMQNILNDLDQVVEQRFYNLPYHPEAKFSLVNLEDVAEAAALVLSSDDHIGAIYELNGPEILSVKDVIGLIGNRLQMRIDVRRQTPQSWAAQPGVAALPDYKRERLVKMFEYYDQHGLWGNSNVLAWLLGRKPTTFQQVLAASGCLLPQRRFDQDEHQ